jgi:hypothetical protein
VPEKKDLLSSCQERSRAHALAGDMHGIADVVDGNVSHSYNFFRTNVTKQYALEHFTVALTDLELGVLNFNPLAQGVWRTFLS